MIQRRLEKSAPELWICDVHVNPKTVRIFPKVGPTDNPIHIEIVSDGNVLSIVVEMCPSL